MQGKNEVTAEKPGSMPVYLPQIPHGWPGIEPSSLW